MLNKKMQIPPNFLRGTVNFFMPFQKGLSEIPETKILRLQLFNFGVICNNTRERENTNGPAIVRQDSLKTPND